MEFEICNKPNPEDMTLCAFVKGHEGTHHWERNFPEYLKYTSVNTQYVKTLINPFKKKRR